MRAEQPYKMLGKAQTIADPHGKAREKTMTTLTQLRANAAYHHLEWDELVMFHQLMVLGYANYGCLLGTPSPEFLHQEGTLCNQMLKKSLGV